MDVPVNVPVDDPHADTEWNDILRKHGVIPEKPPSPTEQIEEALQQARRLAHDNRLEQKTIEELDGLEDEEDDTFLACYRQKRLIELNRIAGDSVYNQVYHLHKPEYAKEVTDASRQAFVLVLLTSSNGTNVESSIMEQIWRDLASRFGDIKFCQMRGDLCIEEYPDKNTPTLLVYTGGEIVRQIVTLKELRLQSTTAVDVEKLLLDIGALRHGDSRIAKNFANHESANMYSMKSANEADEDSDWD